MITLKNYIIELFVLIGLMFFFTGNAFGAKSTNAGQTQAKPGDNFDFFPDYRQEAEKNNEIQQEMSIREKEKNKKDGVFVTSAKWIGRLIPYEFLYVDYAGFVERATGSR